MEIRPGSDAITLETPDDLTVAKLLLASENLYLFGLPRRLEMNGYELSPELSSSLANIILECLDDEDAEAFSWPPESDEQADTNVMIMNRLVSRQTEVIDAAVNDPC